MTSPTGRTAIRSGERTARAAFTLVELLLVMTLLIVVTSLAAPLLGNFFRGRSLDSEARRLLALSRYAQSRAVSEGVPMTLWLDAPGRTYGLVTDTSYDASDARAVEFTLGKDLEFEIEEPALAPAGDRRSLTPLFGSGGTTDNQSRLPALRFTPDGALGAANPPAVGVRDRDGVTLWLMPARNHLSYEIRSTNNQFNAARP